MYDAAPESRSAWISGVMLYPVQMMVFAFGRASERKGNASGPLNIGIFISRIITSISPGYFSARSRPSFPFRAFNVEYPSNERIFSNTIRISSSSSINNMVSIWPLQRLRDVGHSSTNGSYLMEQLGKNLSPTPHSNLNALFINLNQIN